MSKLIKSWMPRQVVVVLDARVEGIESDTTSLEVVLGDR